MNKRTYDCKVFETGAEAREHGIGGIWYDRVGEGRTLTRQKNRTSWVDVWHGYLKNGTMKSC